MKKFVLLSLLAASVAYGQDSATSSTSLTTKAPSADRKLQLTFKSEFSSELEKSKTTGGTANSENKFKATYLFDENVRAGLYTELKTELAGLNESQSSKEWTEGDLAAVVETSHAGLLGADKTNFEGRVYFPTSRASKDAYQELKLRAELNMPYTLTEVYGANFMYRPEYTFGKDTAVSINDKLTQELQAKLDGKASKYLSAYGAINYKLEMNDKGAFKRTSEKLGPEVGADITVNPLVKLNLSMAQSRDVYEPSQARAAKTRQDYALFDTEDTKYYLKATIKY